MPEDRGTYARILLGTRNRHKEEEIRAILASPLPVLCALQDFPHLPEKIEEAGATYEENAAEKALYYAHVSGLPTLTDDSGLEVDFLQGEPGILSARFLGSGVPYSRRNSEILERLRLAQGYQRTARFVCAVALATPEGTVSTRRGVLEGYIANEARGKHGFGYDPIFLVPQYGKTLAELKPEIKNRISHRARALQEIRPLLEDMVPGLKSGREI